MGIIDLSKIDRMNKIDLDIIWVKIQQFKKNKMFYDYF